MSRSTRRRRNRDRSLRRLVSMHTYCRPAGSETELEFVTRFLKPLGVERDRYGNYSVVVGDCPSLVWSCHTDTVHHRGGRQRVKLSADGLLSAPLIKLDTPVVLPGYSYVGKDGKSVVVPDRLQEYATGSGCLGADDTAGVWLLAELIRRGVPGRYLFHYGEECGCEGSRALADDVPAWAADARFVIALDRKDTGDIITHQCGSRTASDAFAWSLAKQLNAHGLHYSPSDRGLYTDSDSYSGLVAECTNLSIGYAGNHSQAETLDTTHCLTLLDALASLDVSALVSSRDPYAVASSSWRRVNGAWVCDGWPDDIDDASLPVARSEVYHYCIECGAYVELDDPVCNTCGEPDPADYYEDDEPSDTRRAARSVFLDTQFAAAQAALSASLQVRPGASVLDYRACAFPSCAGSGPMGGRCSRCWSWITGVCARVQA